MVRPLRIEYEGAVYHITSRGNARQDTFQQALGSNLVYCMFMPPCFPIPWQIPKIRLRRF
jgi:hypothetical protein